MYLKISIILTVLCSGSKLASSYHYEPNWDSLDARPLPIWYDRAKIGIFIHWGVYSVPSYGDEWFWFYLKSNITQYVKFMSNYPKDFTYQDFASDFRAEFFNATEWAVIFKKSGAKYIVLTTKHHEGFTLWPSKYSFSWNSVDVGPHRDIVAELSNSVKLSGLRFGVYHSLFEWFNPLYLSDKASNYTNNRFVREKIVPEMIELVMRYKPDVFWSDGSIEANSDYWRAKEFLVWLYNDSPVRDSVVTNDRWGSDASCHHGGYLTCSDRFNPGQLLKRKWENAMSLDSKSFGYRREAKLSDLLTIEKLIVTLLETVSFGGNILINIGPTKEGTIPYIFQERLTQLGSWLNVNGEAIYETRPWNVQNDTIGKTWYTVGDKHVYAITSIWPPGNVLRLGSSLKLFSTVKSVHLLGYSGELTWEIVDGNVHVQLPKRAKIKTEWAWCLKLSQQKFM